MISLMGSYTIGSLAKAAGVPLSTVRFYERRGLLLPDARSGADYRLYGASSLNRLRFIRTAQATGFTNDGQSTALCGEVRNMVTKRLEDVDRRLREMRRVRLRLREAKALCAKSRGDCPVIAQLWG